MTDDTADDQPTAEGDERAHDDAPERVTDDPQEPANDDAQEPANDDGEDEQAATATHVYVWRCTGCKAQYDERPERCERCGGDAFQRYRDL